MHANEWFQETEQVPPADLALQVRLLGRVNAFGTAVLVVVWLALGVTPDGRTAALALALLLVVALAVASATLIAFTRLPRAERPHQNLAFGGGVTTFALSALIAMMQLVDKLA